ncbi:hypothetical protein MMC28_011151 [Mycoblastus sanguinarius]|nr:hypothetical protein [Mycoblastus sanguinarius]
MAKRKSITGVRKKKVTPIFVEEQNGEPDAHETSHPELPLQHAGGRPRQLLSTQSLPSIGPLSKQRDRRRVDKIRDLAGSETRVLQPEIKHISQDTIRSKWAVLNDHTQAKVEQLFQSVEQPVLARHTSGTRKIEAQVEIGFLTETLRKRIPKMPFPPKTKEMHFDYELLTNSNRDLHQRLTTTAGIAASLRGEVGKQSLALASEKREIENLEQTVQAPSFSTTRPEMKDYLIESPRRNDTPQYTGLVDPDTG